MTSDLQPISTSFVIILNPITVSRKDWLNRERRDDAKDEDVVWGVKGVKWIRRDSDWRGRMRNILMSHSKIAIERFILDWWRLAVGKWQKDGCDILNWSEQLNGWYRIMALTYWWVSTPGWDVTSTPGWTCRSKVKGILYRERSIKARGNRTRSQLFRSAGTWRLMWKGWTERVCLFQVQAVNKGYNL